MKKLLLIILSLFICSNVSATSGTLRSNSIVSCDGVTYGIHGSDNHYHIAILKDGKYIASGDPIYENPCPNENNYDKKIIVTFSECVDGDTAWLNIDGVKTKFRFLAIDTPETVHPTKDVEVYGKDASAYTCNVLKNATKIEVEYDSGSSKFDKYDRNLAWIFVDDNLLQEDLIKIGYAKVAYIYGNYKYTKNLCYTQSFAIKDKLGLWNDTSEEGYCSTISYSTSSNINKKAVEITPMKKEELKENDNLLILVSFIIGSLFLVLTKVIKKR